MADAVPWDEETDNFITEIDANAKDSANSLRDLLTNPQKTMRKAGSAKALDDIRARVNGYFDSALGGMSEERQKLTHELESLNAQYIRMDHFIGEKALSLKVPYIKPALVEVNESLREEITIDQYSDEVELLAAKLASVSAYVADLSASYDGNMLGSWLFSGSKPYVLSFKEPDSPVITIERSRGLIIGLLDNVAAEYVSH